MTKDEAISKILETLTSVKFFVIILSTGLFTWGKLDEQGWIMMVLTTTGMRIGSEVVAAYKEVKSAVPAKGAKK